MLLLGVLAAQAEAAPAGPPAYDLLETEILTGTQASVTFSSLNSTYGADYQHLQIRLTARTNVASTVDNYRIQLNGDTGTNYAAHRLYGDGSNLYAQGYSSEDYMRNLGAVAGDTADANTFGVGVIDLLDAFNTSKYTTVRSFSGTWRTTSGLVSLNSGLWMNTNAVDSILIDGLNGSFVQYSRFSLYGLKAA